MLCETAGPPQDPRATSDAPAQGSDDSPAVWSRPAPMAAPPAMPDVGAWRSPTHRPVPATPHACVPRRPDRSTAYRRKRRSRLPLRQSLPRASAMCRRARRPQPMTTASRTTAVRLGLRSRVSADVPQPEQSTGAAHEQNRADERRADATGQQQHADEGVHRELPQKRQQIRRRDRGECATPAAARTLRSRQVHGPRSAATA